MMNSISFYFSGKPIISTSILNDSLARLSILGLSFFPFSTLNTILVSSGLKSFCWQVSWESYVGVPCCLKDSFLVFNFWGFNYNVSWYGSLGFILFGTLCILDLDVCFANQVTKVFSHFSSNMFWRKISLSSPSGPLWMLIHLMLSHRSLKLSYYFIF